MSGQEHEHDRNPSGQDQAAGKPKDQQGGRKLDDETSKAQEDAAKERAENGGYQ